MVLTHRSQSASVDARNWSRSGGQMISNVCSCQWSIPMRVNNRTSLTSSFCLRRPVFSDGERPSFRIERDKALAPLGSEAGRVRVSLPQPPGNRSRAFLHFSKQYDFVTFDLCRGYTGTFVCFECNSQSASAVILVPSHVLSSEDQKTTDCSCEACCALCTLVRIRVARPQRLLLHEPSYVVFGARELELFASMAWSSQCTLDARATAVAAANAD